MTAKDTLPRQYRYRYACTPGWKGPEHSYEVIGARGGLHFHVTDNGEGFPYGNRFSAGLEVHYRKPPTGRSNEAPDHDDCWLLKCPCWHDGTTLYAEQFLLPLFDGQGHQRMWLRLAADADERFAEKPAR